MDSHPRGPQASSSIVDRGGVQAVVRALALLEALSGAPGTHGVSDLASATGLPRATIHRLLSTLVACGYARQEPSTRLYRLGASALRLAATADDDLPERLRPCLAELVELSGETSNLAVLALDAVMYVAQMPSPHRMRMFTEVGNRAPLHSTAVGKVLLAYRPPDEVERLLSRAGLPVRTPNTITDRARLMSELDTVRAQGYALDLEEEELGVRCIAVPVFEVAEEVVALSVSGPPGRLNDDRIAAVVPRILRVAASAGAAARRAMSDGQEHDVAPTSGSDIKDP